jgi:hypothetical protein
MNLLLRLFYLKVVLSLRQGRDSLEWSLEVGPHSLTNM